MLPVLISIVSLTPGQETSPPDKGPIQQFLAMPAPDQPAAERPSAANAPTPKETSDRWPLMKALQGTWLGALLDDAHLNLTGWVDMGATFGSAPGTNLPMGFNYRDNQFSLQQDWVRIERPVITTGTTEPSFGFRVDMILPGTDYRYTVARGLLSDQLTAKNGTPNEYGIDPVQMYAEAFFPAIGMGLDVKAGRFYGQYGVQSIEAPGNALFSHTYTFLDNPFTQTGFVATLQLTPQWSVQSGLVQGQDVFFDGGELQYIGNIKWARTDGRDTVTLSTILCSGRFNEVRGLNNANIFDFVFTHKFNGRLTYTFESLLGTEMNIPGIGTANWLGVVNYFTRDFTPHVSGTVRLEFWDDAQGTRTGFPGLYTTLTTGVNFHPRKDLIFRPELRYDFNGESRPFQGAHGLFTAAMDVILRW